MTRFVLGLLLLAAQLGWVISANRPALWAPFHHHAVFSLSVDVGGQHLATKDALARYQLPAWHFAAARDESWETNDLQFVIDAIEAKESRGSGPVRVELRSRINGAPQPVWRFVR